MAFEGIWVPVITPFENQRLAFYRYGELFQWWEQFDLSGYVLMGSTGELPHLTESERFQLVYYVMDQPLTDKPMMVGCAENSLVAATNFLTYCKDAGIAAALVLPPHYYKTQMKPASIIQYYHQLADQTGLPIFIYHFPAVSGISLDIETILAIAEHPGIVGIKDSSGNVAFQQELALRAPGHFQVFTGSASTLAASLAGGAKGAIVAAANYAPEVCVAIFQAVQQKNWKRAYQLQQRLLIINRLTTSRYGIGGLKYALTLRGQFGGEPRFPLQVPDESSKMNIEKALKGLNAKGEQ